MVGESIMLRAVICVFIFAAGASAVVPVRLQDGLFAGEAVAPLGAKIYFGMERIDLLGHSQTGCW